MTNDPINLNMKRLSTLWDTAMTTYRSGLASHQQASKRLKVLFASMNQDKSTHLYPQKKFPNVKSFKIELLSNHHPVFKEKGILKREFEPLINQESYINKSQNRYIEHQLRRLNLYRGNQTAFWRLGTHLLHHSSTFLSLCLLEVYPGWHRKERYGKI